MALDSASETLLVTLLSIAIICLPVFVFVICIILLQLCCRKLCPIPTIYAREGERNQIVGENISCSYVYEKPPSYESVMMNNTDRGQP